MITTITRWWLIRHAPVLNPGKRIYGRSEIDCDTGDAESFARLAAALPRAATWLATPLSRTQRTAAAIRAAWPGRDQPAQPALVPELVEQHFGEWTGMTHAELAERQPRAAHRFWIAPATERPPGGESFADVVERVGGALTRLTAEHAGGDVVAVAHGGPIRAALALALDLDPEAALRFSIDTLSLTRLDHVAVEGHPPAWRVVGVNLPPGTVPPSV